MRKIDQCQLAWSSLIKLAEVLNCLLNCGALSEFFKLISRFGFSDSNHGSIYELFLKAV